MYYYTILRYYTSIILNLLFYTIILCYYTILLYYTTILLEPCLQLQAGWVEIMGGCGRGVHLALSRAPEMKLTCRGRVGTWPSRSPLAPHPTRPEPRCPPQDTIHSISHPPFTPSLHTLPSHPQCTLFMHTLSSHPPFTPFLHILPSHPPFAPPQVISLEELNDDAIDAPIVMGLLIIFLCGSLGVGLGTGELGSGLVLARGQGLCWGGG